MKTAPSFTSTFPAVPEGWRVLQSVETVSPDDLVESKSLAGFVGPARAHVGNTAGNTGRVIRETIPGKRDIRELRVAPVESLTDDECRALRVHCHSGDQRLTDERIAARNRYYDNRLAIFHGLPEVLDHAQLVATIQAADASA